MNNPLKPIFGLLICYFAITPLFAADYYWVENRGNWSDLSHWATTSGGGIKHTSLPTRNDNVFIDDNSFAPSSREDIILDLSDVYCNDLSVIGGEFINFIGENRRINIHGHCDIQRQNGEGAFDGFLIFKANDPSLKTINFSDFHVQNITFDDVGGTWSVNGNVLIDIVLAVVDGNVTFEEDLRIQPGLVEFAAKNNGSVTLKCNISIARGELTNLPILFPLVIVVLTNMEFETPPEFPDAGFSVIVSNSQVLVNTAGKPTHINSLNFYGADDPLGFNYVQLEVEGGGTLDVDNSIIISNAYINGDVDFEYLTLQANRTYYWESEKGYRIENLTAIGNCTGTIRLFGSIGGLAANFERFGSGLITGQFLQIRDIHVLNGDFEVFNSQDLGNTDGWIINNSEQDFLGEDLTLCPGDTIKLKPFPFSQNHTVLWSDGTTVDTFSAFEPGKIWVDVFISSGCVISDTIIISSTSSLDIGRDTSLCLPDSIVLDATITDASYEWQDGSTMPTYNVKASGTYSVTTVVGACSQTDTIVVDYFQTNIDLGDDTSFCIGDTIILQAPEDGISSVEWQDGSSSPTYQVTTSGLYYLKAFNESCSSTDSIQLVFSDIPVIDLGEDREICAGDSVILDATIAGGMYMWQDGNENSTYSIKESGNYIVNVEVDGCSTKDSIQINLIDRPIIDLGPDIQQCDGDTISLMPLTVHALSLQWSDGRTDANRDIANEGRYFLTGFNGTCSFTDSVDVNIVPPPVIDLGEDQILCGGDSTFLDVKMPNATYLWSDGNQTGERILKHAGVYWVEVEVDGCRSRDSVQLLYLSNDVISLGPDTTLCAGGELAFDFTSRDLTYQWSDGSELPTKEISVPGIYWLEVGGSICTFRDSVSVQLIENPLVDLGRDTISCADDIVLIYNPLMNESIMWSNGSTDNEIMVFESGNYIINVEREGCLGSDSIQVTFREPMSFSLGDDITICDGETIRISPSISGDNYLWQDGSTGPFIEVVDGGIYTLDMDVNGCSVSDEVEVITQSCILYSSYIPNTFSPNQDGSNDTFAPQFDAELIIEGYQMSIYDRWGSLVFQSDDLSNPWDGTYNGSILSRGSYVYVIAVDYIDDRGAGSKMEKGTIDIMR